jgi:hypothetical protein
MVPSRSAMARSWSLACAGRSARPGSCCDIGQALLSASERPTAVHARADHSGGGPESHRGRAGVPLVMPSPGVPTCVGADDPTQHVRTGGGRRTGQTA